VFGGSLSIFEWWRTTVKGIYLFWRAQEWYSRLNESRANTI
jgi:hypothetical protein